MAPVPAGEAFSEHQRDDIVRAVRLAQEQSELRYSVYVGALDGDSRSRAQTLHGALVEAERSVLLAVDPSTRRLEIMTGPVARRSLDDRACALAAVSMTSSFEAGDLAGGIVDGLRALAEHARQPRSLHTDSP